MALLHGKLYVLWIVILPANDKQVFQPAGYKQMAIFQKPQVSRSKKRAFVRLGYPRVERLLCLFRFSPVSLRNTRAADPYLAHIAGAAWPQRIRRNDSHGLLRGRTATGHQQLALFSGYLCSITRFAIIRVIAGAMVHGNDAVRIKT